MALFGSKNKTDEQAAAPQASVTPHGSTPSANWSLSHVLRNPRITEKVSYLQSMNVYTFDVAESANKTQVAEAVRAFYKVNPRKVRIVSQPSKVRRNARTGRIGIRSGGKKAYVFLANGETITVA